MGSKREIIKIDEDLCDGCGLCVPNCPEGALQVIDDKVRLVSDLFCDGLGACIGHCPKDAITIETREAEPYDEKKVMGNIVKQGENTVKAHLQHLKSHGATEYLKEAIEFLKENDMPNPLQSTPVAMPHACPGSAMLDFSNNISNEQQETEQPSNRQSQLRQWPVQLMLVPVEAPYFNGAELIITADCVPFAYADFHENFLKGKIVLIGCPKLDDAEFYKEKLTEIFKQNNLRSVTVLHMEVPCCFGLVKVVQMALEESGKAIPFADVEITIRGEIKPKQFEENSAVS